MDLNLFTVLGTLHYQTISVKGIDFENGNRIANCSQALFTSSLISQVWKKPPLYYWAQWNIKKCTYTKGISYSIVFWFFFSCYVFLNYHYRNIETIVTVVILQSEWHVPPDCECTWCAGHVRPLCFPPHPACTQGWSPQWLVQTSEETHFIIGQYSYRWQTWTWLEVHTSFRNLSIHLVVSIIWAVLSKMSICDKTHSESLWNIIGKQISWSQNRTYCRFKSLISQKFNKMYYFTGGVNWICDENTSCKIKAVHKALHETS